MCWRIFPRVVCGFVQLQSPQTNVPSMLSTRYWYKSSRHVISPRNTNNNHHKSRGIRSHQAVCTQCVIGGRNWSVFSVCVSQEPSLCRAHPHSQDRDRRMSWGSVCSQHDSSHRPLASAWTAHRWRSSSPCPGAPSQCTGQNHPHTQQVLKQRQVNTHWVNLNK